MGPGRLPPRQRDQGQRLCPRDPLRILQAAAQRPGNHHLHQGLPPGANVIKLFTVVIYEFLVLSWSVCPCQASPA